VSEQTDLSEVVYCFHHYPDGSSGWWWRQYTPLKCWSTPMRLHDTISQKALIFRK
jgi:hypothetical protein